MKFTGNRVCACVYLFRWKIGRRRQRNQTTEQRQQHIRHNNAKMNSTAERNEIHRSRKNSSGSGGDGSGGSGGGFGGERRWHLLMLSLRVLCDNQVRNKYTARRAERGRWNEAQTNKNKWFKNLINLTGKLCSSVVVAPFALLLCLMPGIGRRRRWRETKTKTNK